eukprot:COSAG01_NODE_64946_length_274_cov_16.651429_1_plen_62_part_10
MPPPVTTLNLAQFWQKSGTERVSTTQTLFLVSARTDPLLVPPFLKKLFFYIRRSLVGARYRV